VTSPTASTFSPSGPKHDDDDDNNDNELFREPIRPSMQQRDGEVLLSGEELGSMYCMYSIAGARARKRVDLYVVFDLWLGLIIILYSLPLIILRCRRRSPTVHYTSHARTCKDQRNAVNDGRSFIHLVTARLGGDEVVGLVYNSIHVQDSICTKTGGSM